MPSNVSCAGSLFRPKPPFSVAVLRLWHARHSDCRFSASLLLSSPSM